MSAEFDPNSAALTKLEITATYKIKNATVSIFFIVPPC